MTTAKGKSSADTRRLEMLATTPATRAQVGAIAGEFQRRMGVRRRDQRLEISAALLHLDGLNSTADLTMGQAGKLLHILRSTPDRAELDRRVEMARSERAQSNRGGHAIIKSITESLLSFVVGAKR